MAQVLKHIDVLRRSGQSDVLLGWATRDGNTDALYQWVAGWQFLRALPGTNLKYDSTSWRERIYWVDGKNKIGVYDGLGFCDLVTEAPIGQYIRNFQNRLVVGGDARTKAEIEAASLVWPGDSNKNKVIYCEVLDDATWSPNNFIDCTTLNAEEISGLEVGATTTSDEGAQSNLVIFKNSVTMVHRGVLGGADVTLAVISEEHGCPSYHAHALTNKGLIVVSKTSVVRIDPSGQVEPEDLGFQVAPYVDQITNSMRGKEAAIYFKNKLRIAVGDSTSTLYNNIELELDMRPAVFPTEQNWYGPHSGDKILQYVVYRDELIAAENESMNIWRLEIPDVFTGMDSLNRNVTIKLPRLSASNFTREKLDAVGINGKARQAEVITVNESYNGGLTTASNTFTAPDTIGTSGPIFLLLRPTLTPQYDVQPSLLYTGIYEFILDNLYLRSRVRRREPETEDGASQT